MQIFSLAQCLGYLAFGLGVAAFLQKDDRRLKLLLGAECMAYTVHFWMLGQLAASLSAFTAGTRTLLSLKTRSLIVAGIIIAINIGIGATCAKSFTAWFPVVSSCLGTLAVFMLQGVMMRSVLLVCTLIWLANNIICGSIGGTMLETMIAIANFSTIIRLFRSPRQLGGNGSDISNPQNPVAFSQQNTGAVASPGE